MKRKVLILLHFFYIIHHFIYVTQLFKDGKGLYLTSFSKFNA